MTIFTKIIQGQIPCYKIYENDHVFAFLDIKPHNLGHTLIVPKIEIDYFVDVPEPYYSEVFKAAKKISKAIDRATNCKRVGTIIAGFDVAHFHYHLIPMFDRDDLNLNKAREFDSDKMQEMTDKIKQYLD